jgi:Tol biopolymer transport system component
VAGKSVRAPAWSPDGTTLAYMADNGSGQFDIFTLKEGEEPVPLLDGPLSELNPNWSPDGKTIIFVRDKGEPKSFDNDIFKVDVATREVTGPLTDNDVQDGNPVWSPDGSQIAFYRALEASATTGFHIWIMNADGSGQEDLMPDRPGRNLDPMWR